MIGADRSHKDSCHVLCAPHSFFKAWQCYQRFMLTCTHWDGEGGGHIIWAHGVICLYLKLHCAVFFSNRPCQITFKHQACICHLIILSMHSWQPWSLVHYSGSAHTLDEACRSITTKHYHFICAVYAAAHLKYLQILSRIYVYTMGWITDCIWWSYASSTK